MPGCACRGRRPSEPHCGVGCPLPPACPSPIPHFTPTTQRPHLIIILTSKEGCRIAENSHAFESKFKGAYALLREI